jgi:tetratricopeptide (TPR) repeat protein
MNAEAGKIYRRALDGYEKAWGPDGYEKAWGPDYISTLSTINNLGNLYADQGKLGEAEKMYRRALDGYEKA